MSQYEMAQQAKKVLSIINEIIVIREEASIWEGLLCADGQAALGPIGITRDDGAETITVTIINNI